MKKFLYVLLSALVVMGSCGKRTASNQSDLNDTIPLVHQHQEFAEAVDSLVYKGLWGNDCYQGIAYVAEAKTGRVVAHSSLVKNGNYTKSGMDSYRKVIESGLTNYISSNQFRKTNLTGIHDNIPIYSRNKMMGGDTIMSEACCLFPEEFTKYEIFVAFMRIGQSEDQEKICGSVVDDIILHITGDMFDLILKKDSVMDSEIGIWGYFQSLCKNKRAEVWTHSYTRDDSLDVWNAVVLLDLFAGGKLEKFPQKELKKALSDMALEQAYRESHGGDVYKSDNPGEIFLFRLLEKVAYYAPTIGDIADTLVDGGKAGQVQFMDWTGMNPLYKFKIYEGTDGKFKVKKQ